MFFFPYTFFKKLLYFLLQSCALFFFIVQGVSSSILVPIQLTHYFRVLVHGLSILVSIHLSDCIQVECVNVCSEYMQINLGCPSVGGCLPGPYLKQFYASVNSIT